LYDTDQILSAINFLKESNDSFYSLEKMLSALVGIEGKGIGKWSATDWAKDRDVLILAPGPALANNIKAIQGYVKAKNPMVFCLNINESIPEEMITAYVACHETRILIESDLYSKLKVPIILPLERVPESIKISLSSAEILDYGLSLQKNKFEIKSNGTILSKSLSIFYAISIACASNAKRILLAGADGYEISDPRYKEVVSIFEQYSEAENAIPVKAITKTTYPIEQRSIYDPTL